MPDSAAVQEKTTAVIFMGDSRHPELGLERRDMPGLRRTAYVLVVLSCLYAQLTSRKSSAPRAQLGFSASIQS